MSPQSQMPTPDEPTRSLMLWLPQERNPGMHEPDARKEPDSGTRLQHLGTASFLRKTERRKSVSEDLPSVFSGVSPGCH